MSAKFVNTYFHVNFTAGKPSVKRLLQTAVTVGNGFSKKNAVTVTVRFPVTALVVKSAVYKYAYLLFFIYLCITLDLWNKMNTTGH